MTDIKLTRRNLLKAAGSVAALSVLPDSLSAESLSKKTGFNYCLNMSTIRGQKLGFIKELEVASKAGFNSVEIWINSLQTYVDGGGSLADARKKLNDLGLKAVDAIGFAQWIVDDDNTRNKAIEQLKREMEMLAQLGCPRIAAPPQGATQQINFDLKRAAERYRAILELGDKTGVVPQLEMWGHSKTLSKVSEVMYVALESGHPSAKILLDVFHIFKGGSGLDTLRLVGKPAVDIIHLNDYAASSIPATATDADRVYPGDGSAPIKRILETLNNPEKPLILSLEVFNKNYYAQDALLVAQTGLAKMKAVVKGIS